MRVPFNDLQRAVRAHAHAMQACFAGVLDSGRYILGEHVSAFEREFADYCGVEHCVTVANGSDALELALRAVGVEPGEEVVTVANAAMYATLAVRAVGARPVFADVDDASLTLTPASLRSALTPRTRAVIATHLYGRLADVGALVQITTAAGIGLIEDCAQAHGASIDGKRAGSFGDVGCFSFYPTKNLGALGDGGALTTHRADVAARLRALRQYGWQQKYEVTLVGGRNSRLDEVQAAFLRMKLAELDACNARRREIANAYSAGITHPSIVTPAPSGTDYVAHLYVVRAAQRESLRAHLAQRGVGTEVHYPIPDHRQVIMTDSCTAVTLPVTERACREVLSLPCFPELADSEVQYVIDACNAWTP